jgi:hypothetical protein
VLYRVQVKNYEFEDTSIKVWNTEQIAFAILNEIFSFDEFPVDIELKQHVMILDIKDCDAKMAF